MVLFQVYAPTVSKKHFFFHLRQSEQSLRKTSVQHKLLQYETTKLQNYKTVYLATCYPSVQNTVV